VTAKANLFFILLILLLPCFACFSYAVSFDGTDEACYVRLTIFEEKVVETPEDGPYPEGLSFILQSLENVYKLLPENTVQDPADYLLIAFDSSETELFEMPLHSARMVSIDYINENTGEFTGGGSMELESGQMVVDLLYDPAIASVKIIVGTQTSDLGVDPNDLTCERTCLIAGEIGDYTDGYCCNGFFEIPSGENAFTCMQPEDYEFIEDLVQPPEPTDPPCLSADVDGSGTVDVSDYIAIKRTFGSTDYCGYEDTDGDGAVGWTDLQTLGAQMGQSTGPCYQRVLICNINADLTGDSVVDGADVLVLNDEWGPCINGCNGADLTGPAGASDGVVDLYDSDFLIGFLANPGSVSFDAGGLVKGSLDCVLSIRFFDIVSPVSSPTLVELGVNLKNDSVSSGFGVVTIEAVNLDGKIVFKSDSKEFLLFAGKDSSFTVPMLVDSGTWKQGNYYVNVEVSDFSGMLQDSDSKILTVLKPVAVASVPEIVPPAIILIVMVVLLVLRNGKKEK